MDSFFQILYILYSFQYVKNQILQDFADVTQQRGI